MSAMGHEQTFRGQAPMSALSLKADIDRSPSEVRSVPKVDSSAAAINARVRTVVTQVHGSNSWLQS